MSHYTHLSLVERQTLYNLYQKGLPIRLIAKQIGRHFSALYRELARHRLRDGSYNPLTAQQSATKTQHQLRRSKIQRYSTLRQYIRERLKQGWSPEQIAGRLKRKKSKYVVCHETIYKFI